MAGNERAEHPGTMTIARPVFPGRFLFITRRCTQRQFLLRPDDETNQNFTYCLAEAAKYTEMEVILPQMMSNHQHVALYDRNGREVEFRQRFHGNLARSQNALRGRWENFWVPEEPCVIEVVEVEELLNKLLYIAINPVKAGLVENVRDWPGPKFVLALLSGKPMRAVRPKHFFRDDGPMPEAVELVLKLPDDFPEKEAFLAELERRIERVEAVWKKKRAKTGRRVLGRRRVLRQSWRDCPTSREPRRGRRPRVAARSKWVRIAMLQRNKQWEREYRQARIKWLAKLPVEFPYGTYWLQRFANVSVEPRSEAKVRPPPLAN